MYDSIKTFLRTNRGKQLNALIQLLLIVYIIQRYSTYPICTTTDQNNHIGNGNHASRNNKSNGIHTTSTTPSTTTQDKSVFYKRIVSHITHTWSEYNHRLHQYQPWTIILSTLGIVQLINKWSLLMGLSPPSSSLITEPDMNYSITFQQARYILTSFDAAVLSTLRLKPAIFRHLASLCLLFWYLIFNVRAEHKVEAFRRSLSVRYVRAMWQKGEHPVLHALTKLIAKRAKIHLFRLDVNNIECYLFYNKSISQLPNENSLILDYPGGGFVSMSVSHHADYLSQMAITTGVPLLSVQYRKAPECPYPSAVNDCYNVYKHIIQTNGHCININTNTYKSFDSNDNQLRIVLVGDSAGGNLVMSATYHALVDGIRVPNGCHLIYPALDLSTEIWRSAYQQLHSKYDDRHHYHHNKHNDSNTSQCMQSNNSAQLQSLSDATTKFNPFGEDLINNNPNRPLMTSKALYAFDGVLPMRYMILIGQAYLRNGGNPTSDYFISPLRAPSSLMNELPPVYIHCGSVDPLSDDSIFYIQRLNCINPNIKTKLQLIPGISHAYMQITSLLPEGKYALELTCNWINELLACPAKPVIRVDVAIPDSIPNDINQHSQQCNDNELDRVAGHSRTGIECNDVAAGDNQVVNQVNATTNIVQSRL